MLCSQQLCYHLAKTNPFFCFLGFPNHPILDAQNVFAKSLGRFVGEYGFPWQTAEKVQTSELVKISSSQLGTISSQPSHPPTTGLLAMSGDMLVVTHYW